MPKATANPRHRGPRPLTTTSQKLEQPRQQQQQQSPLRRGSTPTPQQQKLQALVDAHAKRKTATSQRKKSSNTLVAVTPSKSKQQRQQRKTTNTATTNASSSTKNTKSKGKGRKQYRKVKQLRPCVPRAIFFIPLAILALERYIGKLIHLEDVQDVVYKQLQLDVHSSIWGLDLPKMTTIATPPSILNVTFTPRTKCPPNQRRMINVHNPSSWSTSSQHLRGGGRGDTGSRNNIPMMIHQHAPTRCVPPTLDAAAVKWASFRRWSYYFWDDDAIDRFLSLDFPEFPNLKSMVVVSNCLVDLHHLRPSSSTTTKIELWSFVNLWLYGGLYVDINYLPTGFNASTILANDNGVFLKVLPPPPTTTTDPIIITPKIMAVTPHHPIMYFAIQRIIQLLLSGRVRQTTELGSLNLTTSSNTIGQMALNQAWKDLREGGGFPDHQSIRIIGTLESDSMELVAPVFTSDAVKEAEYNKMGATLKEGLGLDDGGGGEKMGCLTRPYFDKLR